MSVYDDLASAVRQRVDDEGERGLKVVPVVIATLSPLTVTIQGSTATHPAIFMSNEGAVVGESAYGIWLPGQTKPFIFTPKSDWVNFTLTAAGGSGTARIKKVGGLCCVQFALTGASIATGSTPTNIVNASGGVPVNLRPPILSVGMGNTGGNTQGTINVNTDGSISVSTDGVSTATVLRANFFYGNATL